MGERGISEGRGEGGSDSDENERNYDGAVWEYRRWGGTLWCIESQIEEAYRGGEERLHGVEEDREFEELGYIFRSVWSCCQPLLKKGPGKTARHINTTHHMTRKSRRTMRRKYHQQQLAVALRRLHFAPLAWSSSLCCHLYIHWYHHSTFPSPSCRDFDSASRWYLC